MPMQPLKCCHAHGCARMIKPRLLMCHKHWAMVPRKLQDRIYLALYDMDEGRSQIPYLAATSEAVLAVASIEDKPAAIIATLQSKAERYSAILIPGEEVTA